jgi:two-component system sensor histidine kinase HydH
MQTQLMRARHQGDSEDDEMTASVLHDIEQVESVIRDLLELARPGELRLEPTSVNVVARDALRQLAAQLNHRRIAVDATLDDELPPVQLDPQRFKQVLLNVLNNAAEAMPTGGVIHVVSRLVGNEAVCLRICDTGSGIDPQLLDRVFDAFVSTKRDGMGLGLVNAKAVIESHGGRIVLENREPRGACVNITLPLASRADRKPGQSHG